MQRKPGGDRKSPPGAGVERLRSAGRSSVGESSPTGAVKRPASRFFSAPRWTARKWRPPCEPKRAPRLMTQGVPGKAL